MKKVCIVCGKEPDIRLGIKRGDTEVGEIFACKDHAEQVRQTKMDIYLTAKTKGADDG